MNCRECKHFGIDGGPGSIMVCNHFRAPGYGGYIIYHHGWVAVSDQCPLGLSPPDPKDSGLSGVVAKA